ncbi:MAG: hypothetical protein VX028_00735 [Nanoarchaeota archaeon]|nr:hypothetical protein [Nanoarchaeota archaeon]
MMKKLLPLAALSASSHAAMIPIELEQHQERGIVSILLQETSPDINLSQLYLTDRGISFRDLDIFNPDSERYRLFSNSMRIYDTNSDDMIRFEFNYSGILENLDIGIGYYGPSGYTYEREIIPVTQVQNEAVNVSEPFGLGLLGLGLYCMYRQREDKSYEKLRKMT